MRPRPTRAGATRHPRQAERLLVSYLGSSPEHQPYGVQKFRWDADARRFEQAWVNREISSPSRVHYGVPWGRVRIETQ